MLLAYREDDVVGRREGKSVYPMHVTPLSVTISSSLTVVSMFPPASAARSTVTLPDFIFPTISRVTMTGAVRPGMRAVVMTTSTSSHCLVSISRAAACHSALISLAYPPAPLPSSSKSTSRNCPPIASTCSFVTGRTSKALTMAPMFLAVWMAASPATPVPSTKTLAGGTFPAAVICPAKNLPKEFEASSTARYPEILAWLDRAS
mmetsp:Transcript_18195/g.41912  ORF Transcript_18195/g.41912 Transcript_18195/m.41912 type:complete len:205 (+) Transcript_18195:2239-2853(+)